MSRNNRSRGSNAKGGFRRAENNKIYANALPLIFTEPPVPFLPGLLGLSNRRLENPHCEAIFDPSTRSCWVTNEKDSMILWRRGFFGKGNLSRSEPSWLARQLNNRKTGKSITSEEVREKRRLERKQFKLDRAKAIAAVAAEAESIFETEGRVVVPSLSGPEIPSAATWKPTPVDIKPPAQPEEDIPDPIEEEELEPVENIEHLQLTLQEAFFLIWAFDCLTVLDPNRNEPMTLPQIWVAFQRAHLNIPIPHVPQQALQWDNPFLIHYVVYHHYRSLGWVVKGGIKFCVDYLLYKRGPVFAHAEFAIVVCPTYEDPADQEASEVNLQNATPFSWSWLSTINRVNSQVLKTLIITYVTIPARSRVSSDMLNSPQCFTEYTIRDVVVRRFIPARMRG